MVNRTRKYLPGTRIADLTGAVFERLEVLGFAGIAKRKATWRCRCSCGAEIVATGCNLSSGNTKSCGCLRRERGTVGQITHGQANTPQFQAWQAMIQRCTNPRAKSYPNYGGRGIKVCERWLHSFETFLADMGERPEGKTLDRIDVDGNYEPENCRWATHREQSRNTRSNRHVTFQGQTKVLIEWAELLGLRPSSVYWRISNGWTVERALTTGADPASLARLSDLSDAS